MAAGGGCGGGRSQQRAADPAGLQKLAPALARLLLSSRGSDGHVAGRVQPARSCVVLGTISTD